MLSIFDSLRNLSVASIALRLILTVICGSIVGAERALKRRAAGMRTHILICMGAAIASMTSLHLFLNMHYFLDMARLSASVVTGIGFIGAGCIIVTRRQRIKGLTTAAGLWASAIIGLTFGGGFYEGGILATILIVVVELFFSRLEYWMLNHAPEVNLYLEYNGRACLERVLHFFREHNLKLLDIEITRHAEGDKSTSCAIVTLRLNKRDQVSQLMGQLHDIHGLVIAEEL